MSDLPYAYEEAEIALRQYLDEYSSSSENNKNIISQDDDGKEECIQQHTTTTGNNNSNRVICYGCNKSRCLYCPDCLQILVNDEDDDNDDDDNEETATSISRAGTARRRRRRTPQQQKPEQLKLPFKLDIILDDRRKSSTGIHLAMLLDPNDVRLYDVAAAESELESSESSSENNNNKNNNKDNSNNHKQIIQIPEYDDDDDDDDGSSSSSSGTYLLYPCETSVPLSSVLRSNNNSSTTGTVRRFVVLDCKWRKSGGIDKLYKNLSKLPKVHLDYPPTDSFYWRWHNSGDGMLSSLEAVYYAAYHIILSSSSSSSAEVDGSSSDDDDDNNNNNGIELNQHREQQQQQLYDLLDMFLLFALQRSIIKQRYDNAESAWKNKYPGLPYTKDGKEYNRQLRRKHPNYKQKQPKKTGKGKKKVNNNNKDKQTTDKKEKHRESTF